jgi:hypothetical protein
MGQGSSKVVIKGKGPTSRKGAMEGRNSNAHNKTGHSSNVHHNSHVENNSRVRQNKTITIQKVKPLGKYAVLSRRIFYFYDKYFSIEANYVHFCKKSYQKLRQPKGG